MMGAGLATAVSYFLMAFLMWLNSHLYYAIPYEWGRILKIASVAAIILLINSQISIGGTVSALLMKTFLLTLFIPSLYFIRFFALHEIEKISSIIRVISTRFRDDRTLIL